MRDVTLRGRESVLMRANRSAAIAKGLSKDERYSSKLNTRIQ